MKNPIENPDDLGKIIRGAMDEVTAIAKRIHPPTGQNPEKIGKIRTKSTDTTHTIATRSAKPKGRRKQKSITHQRDKDQVSYKEPDKSDARIEQIKQTGITQSENAVNKMSENVNPLVQKTANNSFGHGNLTGRETGKALGRSDAEQELKPKIKKSEKTIKRLKTVVKVGTPITGIGWILEEKQRRDKNAINKKYQDLLKKYNAK